MKEIAIIICLLACGLATVVSLHAALELICQSPPLTPAALEWNRKGEERIESQIRQGRPGFVPFIQEDAVDLVDPDGIFVEVNDK